MRKVDRLTAEQMRKRQAKRARRRNRVKGTAPKVDPAVSWLDIILGLGWKAKNNKQAT